MDDAVALAAGAARVAIAPRTGGAIASFTFDGQDVLRPAPAGTRDVRAHAGWPLVPYSNRIAHARFEFAGRAHVLARNFGDHPHSIHGVGWQRPWAVAARAATRARLVFDHSPDGDGARAWPWAFRATQLLALRSDAAGAALTITLTIANTGSEAFPFGLGFHPFFVRTAATRLAFRAAGVWATDATMLPTTLKPALREGPFDAGRDPGPTTIDNAFAGWEGVATLRDEGRRLGVTVAADRAASFLVVYAPGGGECIALEPATQMTDAFNRAARGEQDTGTRTLRPGGAFSCTMEIAVHRS
ncbi:MAG TPA: aldose 1-epimerase [Casimicrobiaceae bacterium]|nr:aldose 1-epimerase [Casimicrobiaceae bacterium]